MLFQEINFTDAVSYKQNEAKLYAGFATGQSGPSSPDISGIDEGHIRGFGCCKNYQLTSQLPGMMEQ
jgi:hypothetical protein